MVRLFEKLAIDAHVFKFRPRRHRRRNRVKIPHVRVAQGTIRTDSNSTRPSSLPSERTPERILLRSVREAGIPEARPSRPLLSHSAPIISRPAGFCNSKMPHGAPNCASPAAPAIGDTHTREPPKLVNSFRGTPASRAEFPVSTRRCTIVLREGENGERKTNKKRRKPPHKRDPRRRALGIPAGGFQP